MVDDVISQVRDGLGLMAEGRRGEDRLTIHGVGPGQVQAVADEFLDHQTRGGRPLRGLRVDAALAPALGCGGQGPCSYRGVPVVRDDRQGVVVATLGPAP